MKKIKQVPGRQAIIDTEMSDFLFIKLLPAEGPIKIGDLMYDRDSGYFEKCTDTNFYRSLNCLKAIFYLCDREIKAGDTVKMQDDGSEAILTEIYGGSADIEPGFHCKFTKPLNPHVKKNTKGIIEDKDLNNVAFKTIGIISPDAIWVRDGMELKRSEVEEWWWNPEIGVPVMKKLVEEWDRKLEMIENGKLQPVYLVRCSQCQKFH